MEPKTIGALTIGQSPRPDLVAPLEELLPECQILQAGALDGFRPEVLPQTTHAAYPLLTRMKDGSIVMVDDCFITPKLQVALELLEGQGVVATLLLCAGTFADLQSTRPLFKPFEIGCAILNALRLNSIGLIVPAAEQESPTRLRWERSGYQTTVWTADLGNQDRVFYRQLSDQMEANGLDCLILDYVGHPEEQVTQLQRSVDLPVFDLGHLAMVTMASTL